MVECALAPCVSRRPVFATRCVSGVPCRCATRQNAGRRTGEGCIQKLFALEQVRGCAGGCRPCPRRCCRACYPERCARSGHRSTAAAIAPLNSSPSSQRSGFSHASDTSLSLTFDMSRCRRPHLALARCLPDGRCFDEQAATWQDRREQMAHCPTLWMRLGFG
jgi:hypothetical protein